MKPHRRFPTFTLFASLFASLVLAGSLFAQTGTLTLAWDPNPETDLQGYQLYYKSQGSGAPYDGTGAIVENDIEPSSSPIVIDPSPAPQITLSGLDPALDYEFAVTAFNASGESGFSTPVRIYSIDSQAGENGGVDPQGPGWVLSGDDKTVSITPDAGFNVADVRVDGASVGAVTTYTFSSVTGNHTLSAQFEPRPPASYTITSQAGSNGSVSPNGAIQVASGGSQTITIAPNSGYRINDVTVDGNSVGALSSYTFSNVTGDHTLNASFVALQHTISATAHANGQVSPSGSTTVNHGGSQTISITPNSGYRISNITVDGNSVGAVSSYTFSNVTADHTLNASFEQVQAQVYTLTCQAGANGQVSPSGSIQVDAGASRTVTITPNAGCVVADVKVDGASMGAVRSYTFNNIDANHTLSATFAQDTTDSDGDGLTDYEETHTYGSDPQLADSDDDGIHDGDEVAYWGNAWNQDIDGDSLINLLDADADGDGYWDGEELDHGSDPGDPESKPLNLVMEFGEVEIDHNWKTVTLDNTKNYINPVVIAGSLSFDGGNPSVIRLRNVSAEKFEIRIQEWDYLDGAHVMEKVGYLVMEAGVHTLDDGSSEGLKVIAGHFDTNRTDSYGTLTFPAKFNAPPVVLAAVATYNGSDAVTLRQREINESGFEYRLQEQESFGDHATETIGYIACEPASGILGSSLEFEVGRTADTFKHNFTSVEFNRTYSTAPALIAAMQTADGKDTAALRWRNKNGRGVEIKVEEEQSRDTETNHTTESIGYMIFSTP